MSDNQHSTPAGIPNDQREQPIPPTYPAAQENAPVGAVNAIASDKSLVVTWLFAWLLGFFAVGRFYLGKVGTGLLKLFTCVPVRRLVRSMVRHSARADTSEPREELRPGSTGSTTHL